MGAKIFKSYFRFRMRIPAFIIIISTCLMMTHTSGYENYESCAEKVKIWQAKELQVLDSQPVQHEGGSNYSLKSLLFFLHIPRTGGRTYHQCFLKVLFTPKERCPRSYDTLRLNPKRPECRLLSTHDDFSLMTKLPAQQTSVVTNVRDPGDRLLSAYEFMIEIASRSLRLMPGLNASDPAAREALVEARKKAGKGRRTDTRSVWPWTYLVPLMEDDVWDRKAMASESFRADNGSYDSPRLVMPLKDFASHPLVKDLIHNGGTMQVAGLTNNSYTPDAHFMRRCAGDYEDLGEIVLDVAKKRLDRMLYVGLTEEHSESAKLFAHMIGRPLSSPAHVLNVEHRMTQMMGKDFENHLREQREKQRERRRKELMENMGHIGKTERRTLLQSEGDDMVDVVRERTIKRRGDRRQWQKEKEFLKGRKNRRVVDGGSVSLLHHYNRCVSQNRERYKRRRVVAMLPLAPIKFSSEERAKIPADLMAKIRSMNKLDMALLEHARMIFSKEKEIFGHTLDKSEILEEETLQEKEASMKLVEDDIKDAQKGGNSNHFGVDENLEQNLSAEQSDNMQRATIEVEDKKRWEAVKLELNTFPLGSHHGLVESEVNPTVKTFNAEVKEIVVKNTEKSSDNLNRTVLPGILTLACVVVMFVTIRKLKQPSEKKKY